MMITLTEEEVALIEKNIIAINDLQYGFDIILMLRSKREQARRMQQMEQKKIDNTEK